MVQDGKVFSYHAGLNSARHLLRNTRTFFITTRLTKDDLDKHFLLCLAQKLNNTVPIHTHMALATLSDRKGFNAAFWFPFVECMTEKRCKSFCAYFYRLRRHFKRNQLKEICWIQVLQFCNAVGAILLKYTYIQISNFRIHW